MHILSLLRGDRAASPGVYRIRNQTNGKEYIGSTAISMSKRWERHRQLLARGEHDNAALQQDWNRASGQGFIFEVIEVVANRDYLRQRERYWQDRTPAAQTYVLRRAGQVPHQLAQRRRKESFYVPSNITYTSHTTDSQILSMLALARFDDGVFAFESHEIDGLLGSSVPDTLQRVAALRSRHQPNLMEVDNAWLIQFLAMLQA